MSLRDDAKLIAKKFEQHKSKLEHNACLFDIYEGNLVQYVLEALEKELSADTFKQAQFRVAPVNILRRLVEKLAKLYTRPPMRTISKETDVSLLDFYVKSFDINTVGGESNEFFNLFKNTAFEPYLDALFNPRLRVIPSDRFFVFSTNPSDPMQVTHFVKIIGTKYVGLKECTILYAYTDKEFIIQDSDGNVLDDMMIDRQLDGINPYGAIPFVYAVKSRQSLNPPSDTDTLAMTKLFPVLLTDLNYAVKFQCFSIIYGINVDEENLKMSPNVFWRLKGDATSGGVPSVGVIKPEVDSDKVIQLIQAELAMWLQSRNVRPGSVGSLTSENFASGVSKMVDEMDTVEERQRQVPYFKKFEEALWALLINNMHPVWSKSTGFPQSQQFSPSSFVTVEFNEQLPMQDRTVLLDSLIKEIGSGLTTVKIALKKLNPELNDAEIEILIKEIKEQNTIEVDSNPNPDTSSDPLTQNNKAIDGKQVDPKGN